MRFLYGPRSVRPEKREALTRGVQGGHPAGTRRYARTNPESMLPRCAHLGSLRQEEQKLDSRKERLGSAIQPG
jgi:hypothetical protein